MSSTIHSFSTTVKRVRFDSVFRIEPDGLVTPLKRVRIGGMSFGPNTSFAQDVPFGGVKIARYAGHDLQVEEKDEELVVKGVYK